MTLIILVRHGEVPGIAPPRFRGREDLALTPRGREQAEATARAIAARWRPAAVYTSPLGRCVDTGAAIARACGVAAAALDGLADIDYGAWQGLTHDEVEAREPEAYRRWHRRPDLVRFPGGESLQDVAVRVSDALRLLRDRHTGETIVVVGHDSSNRVLLLHSLELPLSAFWRFVQDPCGISVLRGDADACALASANETAHLATVA
jgi:probable phosphoglycerate mutase